MSSRKEEERNEKIIRGLMKLPPNRRCINCNSLGPQYVCTTFWTFVCMTCSGIHREFTHRVKSVSMAKFTTQEVDALQKGGNQSARDIYLKGWDPQRQKLPDNSNAEKIREFIKHVYVDKKYSAPKSSDKPPRDSQNFRSHEDTRRASSYHSYSQSPPYDFQYEERRYGKHAAILTRKPGSDRGLYEGKFSSFLSPSRLSDRSFEDSFANEGSNSRMSDYSVSSAGDPFRSSAHSPNFQKDIGSPFSETSRDISAEDLQHDTGKDGVKKFRPQRTTSSGSFGSFDSHSMSFKSVSSVNLVEVASEPEQSVETHSKVLSTLSSFPHPAVVGNSDRIDLFAEPFAPQTVASFAAASNKSQMPELSSTQSLDLFQPSTVLKAPTFTARQLAKDLATSPLDLFSVMPPQLSSATVNEKSANRVIPQNEGWATFDTQNSVPIIENATPETIPSSDGNAVGILDPLSVAQWSSFEDPAPHRPTSSSPGLWQNCPENAKSSSNAERSQWLSFQDISAAGASSSSPIAWNEIQQTVEANSNPVSTQVKNLLFESEQMKALVHSSCQEKNILVSWNAFEDSAGHIPIHSSQTSSQQVETQHPSVADHHLDFEILEDFSVDGTQTTTMGVVPPITRTTYDSLLLDDFSAPVMSGVHPYATDQKSSNPFDLPYDPDVEVTNMSQYFDMSSLQAALPNSEMPTIAGDLTTQSWLTPSPVTPYVQAGPQGALGFMAGQSPSTQIPNVQAHGPLASVGGNPFA